MCHRGASSAQGKQFARQIQDDLEKLSGRETQKSNLDLKIALNSIFKDCHRKKTALNT